MLKSAFNKVSKQIPEALKTFNELAVFEQLIVMQVRMFEICSTDIQQKEGTVLFFISLVNKLTNFQKEEATLLYNAVKSLFQT